MGGASEANLLIVQRSMPVGCVTPPHGLISSHQERQRQQSQVRIQCHTSPLRLFTASSAR